MKPSLVKLVDVILKKIEEQPETLQTEKGLRSWLVGQGYNKRDIDAAMKLVQPHFVQAQPAEAVLPKTLRTFSMAEEQKLSMEARNALLRLDMYGLIEPGEREMILDRLDHFDGEVGLAELDYLLSWLIYSVRDVGSQRTIYDVVEGTENTLH